MGVRAHWQKLGSQCLPALGYQARLTPSRLSSILPDEGWRGRASRRRGRTKAFPNSAELKNLTDIKGFVLEWQARIRVDTAKAGGKQQALKVGFANLDGKSARRTIAFS